MTSETRASRLRIAHQGLAATFLIALIAVLAGVAGLFVVLGQRRQVTALRQQLALSRQQVAQGESQNQDLSKQLKIVEEERKTVNEKVALLKVQLGSAATELGQSRKNVEDLQARYESLDQERTQAQTRLSSVTTELAVTKEQATRLEQEKASLQRSVTRLRERLAWLNRDYRQVGDKLATLEAERSASQSAIPEAVGSDPAGGVQMAKESARPFSTLPPSTSPMAGTVELPPIIVRKGQAGVSPPVQGQVVEVNESHGFIVVDKGSLDGVRIGMIFTILRGGAVVGRASVVRVRPQLCASDIVRAGTPGSLEVGDVAIQNGG